MSGVASVTMGSTTPPEPGLAYQVLHRTDGSVVLTLGDVMLLQSSR